MIDMERPPKVGGTLGKELEALEDRRKEEIPSEETSNAYWIALAVLGTITAMAVYLSI